MLVRPARRVYRSWVIDSRRWDHYRPRPADIVIATYPKCGTTWMQRIVSLLVFQSPEPRPVMQISPWIDRRAREPIELVMARLEAQEHPRFLKAHLPADGLPIHEGVRYIHVARAGRDACMSFHNHGSGLMPELLEALDRTGLEDEAIGRPYPRVDPDPARHFHRWLSEPIDPDYGESTSASSFFRFERSWWQERERPNVLLVHYNDLKADLAAEMRRIAGFLAIRVPPAAWPELVEAAGFEGMRRSGDALMGSVAACFQGGGSRFFHKGTNGRWRGFYRDPDIALYEARLRAELPPACRRWVEHGRSAG